MFVHKHPLNKLRLAIFAAIISSNQSQAMANQPWNCRDVNGSWDCSASNTTSLHTEPDSSIENSLDELPVHIPTSQSRPITDNAATDQTITNATDDALTNQARELAPSVEKTPANAETNNAIEDNVVEARESEYKPTVERKPKPTTKEHHQSAAIKESTLKEPTLTSSDLSSDNLEHQEELTQYTRDIKPAKNATRASDDYKNLDWYAYTDEKHSKGVCKGRYISPEILPPETDQPIDLQTVFVSADQSASEIGKKSILTGNVDLMQGNKSLQSPLARLDQETGAYKFEKGVIYREPGLLINSKQAEGNINQEDVTLHDAQFVLHEQHVRGEAKAMTRKTESTMNIDDGTYTFCPPGNEDWKIMADNIDLDTEKGFGKAEHAKLQIFGHTVFYFPVFYFPIDDRRKSGFLYPSFKFSDTETEIAVPYYFNIAPNMDDTLTTTLFSDSGLLLENEFRYLDKNSTNRLSLGYLADNKTDNTNRWTIGLNHTGRYGNVHTNINYTKVSDNDYFDDFGTNLDVDEGENDQINQNAKATYYADTWQSSVLVQKYQTIDDDTTKPYERLPEIRFSGSPVDSFENISFNYRTVLTKFDRDITGLSGTDKITGNRLIINPSINGDYSKTWGYLRPSLKFWYAGYNLEDQDESISSSQHVAVPILEVDSGLYFDRDFSFQEKGYTQTLEPRLYGLYVPYKDQTNLPDFDTSELSFTYSSLFRPNRFSGDDRYGDAQQLSLGLTSRIISEQGRELFTGSIGHAFYFDDRKVRVDPDSEPLENNESDFATAVTWRPNDRVRVLYDAVFDADKLDNSDTTFDVQYQEDVNRVFGLRHRFTEDTRKQTTLSYIWPINQSWSTLGLVQHDWLTEKVADAAFGLEYESCCWKTRLVLRNEINSDNDRESSIALQFVLRGLGGIGKSPTTELSNKIKGFDEREYYNANN